MDGASPPSVRPCSIARSARASHVEVSSRVMYPANVARPDRTIGAAYTAKTPMAASQRPDVQRSPPVRKCGEAVTGDGERDREGGGELRRRALHRHEVGLDDDQREPEGWQKCARQLESGRPLDQQAAPEGQGSEDDRKHQPRNDEAHRCAPTFESPLLMLSAGVTWGSGDRGDPSRGDGPPGAGRRGIEDLDLIVGMRIRQVDALRVLRGRSARPRRPRA